MKILVTGASGFLGNALSRRLASEGHEIALLARPGSNLSRLLGPGAVYEIGRCSSGAETDAFVRRIQPDAVLHTACSYGRRGESALEISDSNFRFGLVILQALLALERPVTFVNTGTALAPKTSIYALTKQQFSAMGLHLAAQQSSPLRFINVALQHMLGPGDDPTKFTTRVIHACYRNESELRLTTGEQRRDFIYIDDVVDAYILLLRRVAEIEPALDVEVGSGRAPTLREFVETVHRLTGSSTVLSFGALPYRENEPMFCQANLSRMQSFGWQPKYQLDAAIKRTLELEFPP